MNDEAIQRLAADYREAEGDQARMAALGQLLIAYSPAGPHHEVRRLAGDAVCRLLEPLARPLAQRAARRLPANDQEDFVASALSHAFVLPGDDGRPRICRFRTEGSTTGRLVCWFRQVFQKLLLTQLRKNGRSRPSAGLADWQAVEDRQHGPGEQFREPEWKVPLPAADVEVLAGLAPVLRVKLVAITAAWLRLPGGLWGRWLDEYARKEGVTLSRPCPPESLIASPNVNQFFQGLAEALGTTVGSLQGVKHQQLPRFRSRLVYLGD